MTATLYDPKNSDHVSQSSPMDLKRKEIADDPSRKDGAINSKREAWTAKQRGLKGASAKPI
jgi:hypothetical protein